MKITLLSLAVLLAGSLSLATAQESSSQPKIDKKSFEYRFADDLRQTPDSIAAASFLAIRHRRET